MARRDYKLWTYHFPGGRTFSADQKGAPKLGTVVKDLDGSKWQVWYIEEGPRVRNARLEPLKESAQPKYTSNVP